MKYFLILLFLLVTFSIFAQQKMVAITIDDLPFVRMNLYSDNELIQKTDQLLTALNKHNAPATGFVNLSKVYKPGGFDSVRFSLLRQWLGKGFDLGNHTFSHPDYNYVSYNDFIHDIEKNEPMLNSLLAEYHKSLIYFRHPYLHRGNNKAKADSLTRYLLLKNYIEAPVTIDNAEWIFAAAYDSVLKTNDKKYIRQVGETYITYMESKVRYYEQQSDKLFGRNIRQVLLIHANSLNADYMDELLLMFEKNRYTFVDLKTALEDELYLTTDHFYKKGGISWLDRWAITQGKSREFFAGDPVCPGFIMKLAKVDSE